MEALSYALAALARKRHTRAQLEQKLHRRQYDENTIDFVLAYCQERKYLDDYEFALIWIEDRIRLKPMGRWRLKQELSRKGVAMDLIEKAVDELLPLEQELILAKQVLKGCTTKMSDGQTVTYKVFNYLARRGFSRKLIYQAVSELGLILCSNDQT